MNKNKVFYRELLKKGYENQYSVKLDNSNTKVSKINNTFYSIECDDNRIIVHNFNNNSVDAYLFNSPEENEVFTHYKMVIENNELIYTATVFKDDNDNKTINTIGAKLTAKNDTCLNKEMFFPEDNLLCYRLKFIMTFLSSDLFNLTKFMSSGNIQINAKYPFHEMNTIENDMKKDLCDSRIR